MTEQSILVYKLFLSLNLPDFSFFLLNICSPPLKKVTPLFLSNPPLKTEVLSSSPPFENLVDLVGGSTTTTPPPYPPQRKKGEDGSFIVVHF